MDLAELVGGVLVDCADPRASAEVLTQILLAPQLDRAAAIQAGLEPELVEVLRSRFTNERERVPELCQEAAAWVLGRRSIASVEPWDLVASLPRTDVPEGLRRTTGETLIQLVAQAKRTLRLVAPFIDQPGLSFMAEALADATTRGVQLEVLLPTRSTRANVALDALAATITAQGRSANFSVSRLREDAPWAHLKVLTSDSEAAYIGSANVTGAGIGGGNLELGVLVRGEPVVVVERVLDIYRRA